LHPDFDTTQTYDLAALEQLSVDWRTKSVVTAVKDQGNPLLISSLSRSIPLRSLNLRGAIFPPFALSRCFVFRTFLLL
jgi:hypothetical protein